MAGPDEPEVWDVLVVGAGGCQGSATMLELARRGQQVLGLEAQPSAPHSFGSSHGLSRIIRMSYFEHPSYVPLLRECFRLWRRLEADAGERLLTLTGCLNAEAPGVGVNGVSLFQGALDSAEEHSLPHEVLTGSQVSQRFPGYRLPPAFRALHETQAGFLAPEKCIAAHLRLAQQAGARLLCGARVLGWQLLSPGGAVEGGGSSGSGALSGASDGGNGGGEVQGLVRVHTSRGSFTARRLVLAAGGWMPQLVPELKPLLTVERQVVGWFEVAPEQRQHFSPQAFPVFLLDDESGYYYGFPADEHGFKVGKFHHFRQVSTADDVERGVSPADEEALRLCLRRYFPGADGRMTKAATCTFTNTPDTNFIMDLHPRHPQVVLASCCSGHGFKFAPVIGSILADLALAGTTPHDISLHRLSRQRPGQAAVLDAFQAATGAGAGGPRAARL